MILMVTSNNKICSSKRGTNLFQSLAKGTLSLSFTFVKAIIFLFLLNIRNISLCCEIRKGTGNHMLLELCRFSFSIGERVIRSIQILGRETKKEKLSIVFYIYIYL